MQILYQYRDKAIISITGGEEAGHQIEVACGAPNWERGYKVDALAAPTSLLDPWAWTRIRAPLSRLCKF